MWRNIVCLGATVAMSCCVFAQTTSATSRPATDILINTKTLSEARISLPAPIRPIARA